MMLGMKSNGAFFSNVLNFVFGVFFSTAFDYLLEGRMMSNYKAIGCVIMCAGVVLLRLEQGDDIEANKLKAAKNLQGDAQEGNKEKSKAE